MVTVNDESFHLLSIGLGPLSANVQSLLALDGAEVGRWLSRAHGAGAPLVIVRGGGAIDLYSTETGRRAAFRPVLQSLWSRGRAFADFANVRAAESQGAEVVRHLLRQAVGIESLENGRNYASSINDACSEARAAGTLSASLEGLFRLASTTRERALVETELEAPTSTRASRQLEVLGAERIVEEELMTFLLAAAKDTTLPASTEAPRAVSGSILPRYSAAEPGSSVRLRLDAFPKGMRRLG